MIRNGIIALSTLYFITVLTVKCEMLAPCLFVNHGGGPYPVLGEEENKEIAENLKNIKNHVDFTKINAIILITAHREEEIVTISSGNHHDLLYDYYNFPKESYALKYPARGHVELARKIKDAFDLNKIPSRLDDKRGWDHGLFIPMMLMRPEADIPIVQISILKNQDPYAHYKMGEALYSFRENGVAVIGSGMSYHNMGEFRKKHTDKIVVNSLFDEFLNGVCLNKERRLDIIAWAEIPGALCCHPKGEADHLMPLIVNIGASGNSTGKNIFSSIFMNKFILSGFLWE